MIYYVPDETQAKMSLDFVNVEIYPLEIDIVSKMNIPINDVAEYNHKLVILMNDSRVVKYSDEEQLVVTTDRVIEEMAVHENCLYGLSEGEVYSINKNMFEKEVWKWNKLENLPKDVISIEASLNRKELYLKTPEYGYKIRSDRIIGKQATDIGEYRIYGDTANEYVLLNENGEARLIPSNITFNDVSTGVLMSDGKFLHLNQDNNKLIDRIRRIQGEPIFISRAICLEKEGEKPIIQL